MFGVVTNRNDASERRAQAERFKARELEHTARSVLRKPLNRADCWDEPISALALECSMLKMILKHFLCGMFVLYGAFVLVSPIRAR